MGNYGWKQKVICFKSVGYKEFPNIAQEKLAIMQGTDNTKQ